MDVMYALNRRLIRNIIPVFIIIFVIFMAVDLNQISTLSQDDQPFKKLVDGVMPSDIANYTYGSPNDDHSQGIWGDGMYLYTCGDYNSRISMGYGNTGDLLLVKWDLMGNPVWSRTWDGGYHDVGIDVWGDGTGNIYTCGITNGSSPTPADIVLIKWNTTGNLIWNRTFDYGGVEIAGGVWCNESIIYVCGSTYDYGNNVEVPLLLLWSPDGDLWVNRTYPELGQGIFQDVWGDGWLVCTSGTTYSTEFVNGDLMLAVMDGSGYVYWNNTWGNTSSTDRGCAVWGDESNNLYSTGYTDFGTSNDDMVLIKWTYDANLIWSRTWGGGHSERGNAIWGDNVSIYVGGNGNDGAVLVKWGLNGTFLGNLTFSSGVGNGVWGIGSEVFTCGTTYSPAGNDDVLLVKWFGVSFTTALTIMPHLDITYFENQTGNNIDWILYDSNTTVRNYTIYRDGSWLKNDSWISGISVVCNVDNLTVGQYSYFIIATDGLGETVQDNVTVLVLPNVPPTISNPADFTFNSDTSSIISWTITDASTGTRLFQVFRDGVWLSNGTWSSSVPINLSIGGLPPGVYNYTIIAYDGLGGSYQDTVVVTVVRGDISEPPPYLFIILAIIATTAGTILAIVLVTKARSRKRASPANEETEAARRRENKEASMYKEVPMPKAINQPQVPPIAPVLDRHAPEAPMQRRPTPALCPRCGNALPKEVGRIRFCVYCGEPINTGNL